MVKCDVASRLERHLLYMLRAPINQIENNGTARGHVQPGRYGITASAIKMGRE
jgi:hypothetical protein